MDSLRGIDERIDDHDVDPTDAAVADDRALNIGTDERRMHVRAYNYWVSLLDGRAYPTIDDLDPESLTDFGPNSVLLDFTDGLENPAVRFLGRALRLECSVDDGITHISDVPSRSLLSRLTDHYLQIIANRAPIGFEAEFVSQRGNNTMYRGILMPFSSTGESIDFIYGVINWKELVSAEVQSKLNDELTKARSSAPRAVPTAPVWADGPSGGFSAPTEPLADQSVTTPADTDMAEQVEATSEMAADANLADQLALARETVAAVHAADTRSRTALYRALGRAYDFALAADGDPESYRAMLVENSISEQARAPMTPVVKLIFGADYDKARVTEFAAVLSHAKRHELGAGSLPEFIESHAGGLKAIVKAERAARRPVGPAKAGGYDRAVARLRNAPTLADLKLDAQGEDFVVLLARSNDQGTLDVISRLKAETAIVQKAARQFPH